MSTAGIVHSIQSLGTVDGPGVRFVVFLSGCNLRCQCCHNPDTWEMKGSKYLPEQIVEKALRYREYFGDEGGITLSGGEPLLQAEFAGRVFMLSKKAGINTCLDTSGSVINADVLSLLDYTDRVLLDIKYTDNDSYLKYVGCDMQRPLEFLKILNGKKIPTTVRQVIIPTVNDNEENIKRLKQITDRFNVVDKIELLPFRKICQTKYDNMKLEFKFAHIPEAKEDDVERLYTVLR